LYLVADHHTAQFDAWEVKPDGTVEYQATYWLTYATDPAGISMDESSATLFITSEFSGGVEMVDAITMTSLGVSVGPEDLAGIDVDDANNIVYAVQRYPGSTATQPGLLYVYDWNPVTSNLTLREGYPKILQNCQSSFGLALDDTRGILWVADPEASVVRAYDVATCLTTGSWVEDTSRSFMPSHKPVDIAVDRTRGFVYSVSMSYGANTPPGTGSNILSKYELATGIETTGTLADQGVGVSVDEVTGYVYLTLSPYGGNLTQGDLEVWDTSTNPWTLIQTSKVSGSPAGIYVPNPEVSYNPLHLSKSDTPDPVLPGETITYTIAYDNLGNDFDVHNVIITDYLSAQTIFVSASDGGVYNSSNHTVVWNIGTLPAQSGPYSRTLTALVKEETNEPIIVNYVTIDCDETPPTTICEDTVVGVHDIAISNVTSSKTVVGQGHSLNINVTAANKGDYTETFNVTLYADSGTPTNETGLVGYWSFNEGAGTTAYDSSGNNNHGTLMNGPTWVDGKIGKALYFDGTNDYVRIADSPSLDITHEITITMWVRPVSIVSYSRLIEKTDWWGPYEVEFEGETLKPRFHILGQGHTANNALSLGEWSFLACTYNGTNKRIFINGLLDLDVSATGELATDDNPVTIAGSLPHASAFFNGIIDEVKIYNRSLSADEVWAEYTRTSASFAIQTQTVILESGASTTLTFTWNTTGFAYGNYTLWAYAEPVEGETDTTDNLYVDGTVQITPTYNVTIKAHCNTEGVDVAVSITMDGNPTGYTTPYTFTGLTGTHTFTVPDTDPNGHPFKRWSTGETSTTITVTEGGTYTAYYEAPPPGVGGYVIPVDKFALLAPYIGLASTILIATVATIIYIKRFKKREQNNGQQTSIP